MPPITNVIFLSRVTYAKSSIKLGLEPDSKKWTLKINILATYIANTVKVKNSYCTLSGEHDGIIILLPFNRNWWRRRNPCSADSPSTTLRSTCLSCWMVCMRTSTGSRRSLMWSRWTQGEGPTRCVYRSLLISCRFSSLKGVYYVSQLG